MDDVAIGLAVRTLRHRRGWRQEDLALRAGVSRRGIGRVEAGRFGRLDLATLRAVVDALDASLVLRLRWHGEALDRLLNAGHSALHEAFAERYGREPGWAWQPEVSFSSYGERGIVDVVGWHAARRALVVVELKTAIVDVQELLGTLDRKRRLAPVIARERGWRPATVSAWLVVGEGPTNRRRVAAHGTLLRSAFTLDGRAVRGWLAQPDRAVATLSFLSDGRGAPLGRAPGRGRRVSRVVIRPPHARITGRDTGPGPSDRPEPTPRGAGRPI